jgi:hypothetical protein
VASLVIAGVIGYHVRQSQLQAPAASAQPSGTSTSTPQDSPLGELSSFRTITQDTLDLLNAGDQSGATTRIGDLEYEWDNAEARNEAERSSDVDRNRWLDTVLRELRAVSPNIANEKTVLCRNL